MKEKQQEVIIGALWIKRGAKVKEVTEGRLDFSDYSAKEQEADAKHYIQQTKKVKLIRHAYLMRVDGEWAHFIVSQKGDNIDYYEEMKLPEVVERLKRKFPDYTPKVIQNEGLENYLRDHKPEYKKNKMRQLSIFNER